MAKKNTNAQANVQVLARMTLANGAVVDIYDIDLARQMGLVPGSADAGNAPAQEATASAKQKKSGKGKGKGKGNTQPKADKPTTRTEAVAAWKADRGITADTAAAYKSIYDANFDKDWEKWTASEEYNALKGSARKEANRTKAKEIRNGYRKQAGMNEKSFEK